MASRRRDTESTSPSRRPHRHSTMSSTATEGVVLVLAPALRRALAPSRVRAWERVVAPRRQWEHHHQGWCR